jgi:hypothetical protein
MRGHHDGPPGPYRVQPDRDPAERLQDRFEQVIQRFEVMRDRADRLISAAERIFGPARSGSVRTEPAHQEPTPSEPSEPSQPSERGEPSEPEATGSA